MRISKELIGKVVMDSNALVIGQVSDVDLEFCNDKVSNISLIVSKGGIKETLNITKGEFVIPWSIIQAIGDKIILKNVFESDSSDIDDLDLNKFEEEIIDLKSSL